MVSLEMKSDISWSFDYKCILKAQLCSEYHFKQKLLNKSQFTKEMFKMYAHMSSRP